MERELIQGLQDEVLKAEVIDEIVKCLVEELQRKRSASFTEEERLRRMKVALECERNSPVETIIGQVGYCRGRNDHC